MAPQLMVNRLLERWLQEGGYRVLLASTAAEGELGEHNREVLVV